jgi:hypothetical protein
MEVVSPPSRSKRSFQDQTSKRLARDLSAIRHIA